MNLESHLRLQIFGAFVSGGIILTVLGVPQMLIGGIWMGAGLWDFAIQYINGKTSRNTAKEKKKENKKHPYRKGGSNRNGLLE